MLQSLDRALQALDVISRHPSGLTASQLADTLGIHRSGVYRMVDTLIDHGLASRSPNGRIRLGGGILTMAARFAPHLQQTSDEVLKDLATATRATAFVAVVDADQCVVINTADTEDVVIRLGYRVGSRHSLRAGAAGLAILALQPASDDEGAEVTRVREVGYALTRGQLHPGAVGLAAGFWADQGPGLSLECSVGIVALDGMDVEPAIHHVRQAAQRLARS